MSYERLNSLAILRIHKHKDVDIDSVITEFTRLKGRRRALCLCIVNDGITIFAFLSYCSLTINTNPVDWQITKINN